MMVPPMSEEAPETEPVASLAMRKRVNAAASMLELALEDEAEEKEPFDELEALDQKAGDQIGRYRLVKRLGEGGFGIVWHAEQREPITREVALKIIRPGMDSRAVIARFRAEQKALERMEHPNIAAVLDAGATEERLPFFVMELVRGPPITQYADRHKLDVRARVALMIDVCRAVQHAHQKGIMHRDLKPSNILVAEMDGKPVPKVIDFGIAKAMTDDLDGLGSLAYTAHGIVLGTPQYMAPEQAVLGGQNMDIRVDVYSLGAILYELLTGSPPMVLDRSSRTSVDLLLKRVHDEEAEPPSSRVRHRLSQNLRVPVASSTLKGDLDWVTQRALEKDPELRYNSASVLAEELQRYLDYVPVETGPPNTWYRMQKLVRRHRAAFVSAVFITISLVTATIVSVKAFVHESRARQQADVSRQAAESESKKATAVANFLAELLDHAGRLVESGKNPEALRLALDQSVKQLEMLDHQPEMQAQMFDRLADVYATMGDRKRSLSLRYNQFDAMKAAYGAHNPATLRMRLEIAYGEADQGEKEKGLAICDDTIKGWEAIGMKGSGDWFDAVCLRAVQLGRMGRGEEALQQMLSLKGLKNGKGTLAKDDSSYLRRLAELQSYVKDFEGARATLNRCLELAPSPSKKSHLLSRQAAVLGLARVEAEQGHHQQAAKYLEESIRLTEKISGTDYHPLIETWIELARHYVEEKMFDPAIHAVDAALAIARANGTDEKLPHALRSCAEVRQASGQLAEALPFRLECVDAQRNLNPQTNLWVDDELELLKLRLALGHLDEAEKVASKLWQEIQEHSTSLSDDSFMRLAYPVMINACEKWQGITHSHVHDKDIEVWKERLEAIKPKKKAKKRSGDPSGSTRPAAT